MHPRLSFHGAAGGVTGSCFRLETAQSCVLIDCGMFQGSKSEKELNYRAFPFRPADIDAVLLTHAHIDHSGLLPKLVKDGFTGPIITTQASIDLCAIMLRDSGHIQELEVEQLNRRNARRGRNHRLEPIYTAEDARSCLVQFRPVAYREWTSVAAGVRARFWNAGHLLGSASIEVEVESDSRPLRILFSGDVGPAHALLERSPEAPYDFDYILCEATYGDRDRIDATPEYRRTCLSQEVKAAHLRGGALVIPSFAVERTQELLVDLFTLMDSGDVAPVPIYIDSPLATQATKAFERHAGELQNSQEFLKALRSKQVRFTETTEQSKALDSVNGFHVIIAASGMCEAGRIRHRLRNWLWREEATVLFVGFQAQGTLGRILQEGAKRVRIQGDDIEVKAQIRSLDFYSGHADGPELVTWLGERRPVHNGLFLVHGEWQALEAMRQALQGILRPGQIIIPQLDDAYELTPGGARRPKILQPQRIASHDIGRPDWHNDLAKLVLDIGDAIDQAADEKARAILIRNLRRALNGGGKTA